MHLIPLALSVATLVTTGCSAARTAMGVLSPKPAQITVVNNVEPTSVTVTTASPVTTVIEKSRPRGLMEKVGIVTTSTATGALLGSVIGRVAGHALGPSAIVGASVGAAAGVVMTRL